MNYSFKTLYNNMNQLYIFIEGPNDIRFFEIVIKPLLSEYFECVQFYEYGTKTKKQVKTFLKALNNMGIKYIFVKDFDSSPCISKRKNDVINKFTHCPNELIQIVKVEIESWYAAGITDRLRKKIRCKDFSDCNKLTKDEFINNISTKHILQDILIEILNDYDLELAKKRNATLNYLFVSMFNKVTA